MFKSEHNFYGKDFYLYLPRNPKSTRWQYWFVGFITHRSMQSDFP